MSSADFFTVVIGVFKNAKEAFDQAVREARLVHGEGNTGTIAEKKFYREIKVPREKDPFVFAKEEANRHSNDFWNYCDGPAGCVEVKGEWLRDILNKSQKAKGSRVFVFFGQACFEEKDILKSEEEKKGLFSI